MLNSECCRTSRLPVKFRIAEKPVMGAALAAQSFDLAYRANAAASAGRRAVQSRRRGAKFKYRWKYVAAQEGISEAGMEDVARAGGVHGFDMESWAVMELDAIPGQDNVAAERGSGYCAAETPCALGQGPEQIG